MAVAAPARGAPARTRRPVRRGTTPPAGMARLPGTAVRGTAGAVGGLADSGVVVGLSRTRLWIGLLGLLLGGIVALNVWGLSLSASTSKTSERIVQLERSNSVLKSRIARNESMDRVQKTAAAAGYGVPAPKAIRYRVAGSGDAAKAAERLGAGELVAGAGMVAESDLGPAVAVTPAPEPIDQPAAAEPAPAPPAVPTDSEPAPAAPSDPVAGTPPAEPAPAPEAAAAGGGLTP